MRQIRWTVAFWKHTHDDDSPIRLKSRIHQVMIFVVESHTHIALTSGYPALAIWTLLADISLIMITYTNWRGVKQIVGQVSTLVHHT